MNRTIAAILFSLLIANSARSTEYYQGNERCVVQGFPDALDIGNQIASGTPIANNYVSLLEGEEFRDSDIVEPVDIAYALYVIADRIGNQMADSRLTWATAYISPARRDRVTSAVYRKFSAKYLKRCFSAKPPAVAEPSSTQPAITNSRDVKTQDIQENIQEGHTTEPRKRTIEQGNNYHLYIAD